MELDHDFAVPVPVDQAWPVLLDVERVATCMPGATLDSAEGDEYKGRLKVKVGAMTITYRGTARIVSADESSRTVTLEASGKEARGSGTASATVQAKLHEEDGTTRVTVHTKLNVTGRPAQFGRNILSEVGSKLIARFAKSLAAELESPGEPPAEGEADGPVETVRPEPADKSQPADNPEAADKPGPATAEFVAPVADVPAEPETHAEPVEPEKPAEPEKRERPLRVAREEDAIDLLEVAGPSVAKRAAPAVGGLVAVLLAIRFVRRRRRRK